jgi:hypothetical protein
MPIHGTGIAHGVSGAVRVGAGIARLFHAKDITKWISD